LLGQLRQFVVWQGVPEKVRQPGGEGELILRPAFFLKEEEIG
jgi:hypothetical protein